VPPSVLIVYGSTDGQTAKIAAAVQRTLESGGLMVHLVNASGLGDPDPRDYAAVIVAASIHAGGYQRTVEHWVRAHAASLHDRPNAFLSVCLAVVNRSPKVDQDLTAIMNRFFETTGWQPREKKAVAGALKYREYGWLKRWMMKRIVAKAGGDTDTSRDYEYTDWDDLKEFVERFASLVMGVMSSSVVT